MRNFVINEMQIKDLANVAMKTPTEFGPSIINILNTLEELTPPVADPAPATTAPIAEPNDAALAAVMDN